MKELVWIKINQGKKGVCKESVLMEPKMKMTSEWELVAGGRGDYDSFVWQGVAWSVITKP